VGTDTINLIQTLGFPVVCAAAVGWFGYRVVFYVLRDLSGEIKNVYQIIVKLIDGVSGVKKEICGLEKRLAELREQHRNFSNLLGCDSCRPGVRKSKPRRVN
jgi:hypothetical protein